MIKHIVCWTFADGAEGHTREENAEIVAGKLAGLVGAIDGIESFTLVRPQPGLEASFDLMLNSSFSDADALASYVKHPLHVEVGAYIAKVRSGRWAMDYDPGQAEQAVRSAVWL